MGLLVLLLGTTFFIQSLSQNVKQVSVLQNGIQTCFSRVAQTYTAKLLGETSSLYLDAGFMNATEECFGETMAETEEHFSQALKKSSKKLNTLASDVHWFQQRIANAEESEFSKTTSGISISNLGQRFEKLEQTKDEIAEANEIFKVEILSTLASLKVSFYILSFLLPFMLIWDFAERKSLLDRNKRLEGEAKDELETLGPDASDRVEELIRTALDQNELVYCSKLFSNYHANTSFRNATDFKTPTHGKVELINSSDKQAYDQQIDRIWAESELEDSSELNLKELEVIEEFNNIPEGLDSVGLNNVLGRVVKNLSNKLLAEGIFIDMDIDEDAHVYGNEESMEQVFFHVIQNAVKNSNLGIAPQKVQISHKHLGGTTVIEVSDSGKGFSPEVIDSKLGLNKEELPISLQICGSFMEEFSGEVAFSNNYNADGDVKGSIVKLIFKRAKVDHSSDNIRVRDVQKGTKREILARMKQQAQA
jgi:signal transduction histidine kinase